MHGYLWRWSAEEENTELLPALRVIHLPGEPRSRGGRALAAPAPAHSGRPLIYGALSAAVRGDKVYEKRRRLRPAGGPRSFPTLIRISQGFGSCS